MHIFPVSGKEYWVKELAEVQLPVISAVMQEMNAVTQSDDSCANQLADIILKDSALTAKVLRIANSVSCRPNPHNPINTITRAVVQLGFQGIKAISLSVMLVDSLLKNDTRDRLLECMARSFHTAVQAESLMKTTNGNEQDEGVFITSLLLHLAELALWSCNHPVVNHLDAQQNSIANNPALETELLGCSMKEINQALALKWELGSLLQEALNPSPNPCKSVEAILLAEQISLAAEGGWDSKDFRNVLVRASLYSGLSLEDIRCRIEQGAEQAARVALSFGANKLCHLIPTYGHQRTATTPSALKPHPSLQLDFLKEMGVMVGQLVDVNTLFHMATEGIHRGIGLERVGLCLFDHKITSMQAKYVLGNGTKEWRRSFRFPVKPDDKNVFSYCLHTEKHLWLHQGTKTQLHHLIDNKTARQINIHNSLMSVLYANSRPIGMMIADRGNQSQNIELAQQQSFVQFVEQTSKYLAILASGRKKAVDD